MSTDTFSHHDKNFLKSITQGYVNIDVPNPLNFYDDESKDPIWIGQILNDGTEKAIRTNYKTLPLLIKVLQSIHDLNKEGGQDANT